MKLIRPATGDDMAAVADLWHEGWHAAHAGHVPDGLTDEVPAGGRTWTSPCRRYVKGV